MHYDHKKVMDWHLLMDLLIEPQWGKGGGRGVAHLQEKANRWGRGDKKGEDYYSLYRKTSKKNKGHKF